MCNSPCNTCNYRQKSLDPYGCFKQVSKTGIIGRFFRWLFGCEKYIIHDLGAQGDP
jgi:hypothetical protein